MPVNRRARAIAVGSVLALTVALFSLEYTVKRGDTLSEIARDHDVSLSDVIELNELSNPDLIRPGQVILIPGVDGSVEQLHVVSSGESLNKIASIYGATASAIADANSMANPDLILPGQEILIPTTRKKSPGSGTPSASDGESSSTVTGRARARRHDRVGSTSFSVARPWTRLPGSTQGFRPTPLPPPTGSPTDRSTPAPDSSSTARPSSGQGVGDRPATW